MSPKKRLTKKELKQDEFKVAMMSFVEYYRRHQKRLNYIGFACVAILVIAVLLKVSIAGMNRNASDAFSGGMDYYTSAHESTGGQQTETGGEAGEKNLLISAKESFQMVVNNYSHSKVFPYGVLMLANAEFELGEHDQAQQHFALFLDKYGDTELAVQAKVGLGYVYEQQDQLDKALDIFTSALEGPFHYYSKGELYLDIARIQEKLDNRQAALEFLRKYEEEFPESQRIDMVKEKISSLS